MNTRIKKIFSGIAMVVMIAPAWALPFTLSPEYEEKIKRIETHYGAARKLCDALKDNDKAVCIAEAKAEEKRSKADARAVEKDTPAAKTEALIDHADADLDVARAKCESLNGNPKDVCVKRAEAEHAQSVSVAKANQKVREAHEDALEQINAADYELELTRCNVLTGDAKDSCVNKVKANFNK